VENNARPWPLLAKGAARLISWKSTAMELAKTPNFQLFISAIMSVSKFQSLAKENASMMTGLWTVTLELVKSKMTKLFISATMSVSTFQSLAKDNALRITGHWTVMEIVKKIQQLISAMVNVCKATRRATIHAQYINTKNVSMKISA